MRSHSLLSILMACSLTIVAGPSLTAQTPDAFVPDDSVKVAHFESLRYPLVARVTSVQGIVVVKAMLDKEGRVSSVEPLSGPRQLVADCVANASKWTFHPTGAKTVIIVYDFRIVGLCDQDCSSQFIYKPPNMAVITAAAMVVDHR